MKRTEFAIKNFIFESGERYCLLFEANYPVPLYYPNLYITTQVRNKGLSHASMEAGLIAIKVLLTYLQEQVIDLEGRLLQRFFFNGHEIDGIRDYCQNSFSKDRTEVVGQPIPIDSKHRRKPRKKAGDSAQYIRLTHIGKYLKWLAETLISAPINRQTILEIEKMKLGFDERRPSIRGRNQVNSDKGLTAEQTNVLRRVIEPGSDLNPFIGESIQVRNRLMVMILYELGCRSGEMLNIRIKDIYWNLKQIVIARRADEKDDPRSQQPKVKTLDRRVPIGSALERLIVEYINKYRRNVPNSRLHDYLFVTHKPGPTQGQPISIASCKKVFQQIAQAAPELNGFHQHLLRHDWNRRFSEDQDEREKPEPEAEQEKMRSYAQGWKEGSGTASKYNKRHIRRKAMEAGLAMQEGKTRVPEGLKNDGKI